MKITQSKCNWGQILHLIKCLFSLQPSTKVAAMTEAADAVIIMSSLHTEE